MSAAHTPKAVRDAYRWLDTLVTADIESMTKDVLRMHGGLSNLKKAVQLMRAAPALAEALRAIALALDGERNRFGKLETDIAQRDPLRGLAVKYQTPTPARDSIDHAVHVARAVLAEAGL